MSSLPCSREEFVRSLYIRRFVQSPGGPDDLVGGTFLSSEFTSFHVFVDVFRNVAVEVNFSVDVNIFKS